MSTELANQTNNLASPELQTANLELSRKLPPIERDFEIYEAVHIAGCSTWSQARKHDISQTRVRQIVRRVVEWLGQVLPPQAKIAKEQETHLARQIAAGRFQHQLEEATIFWNETRKAKYASLRLRITTAQARLGVVSGILDGLAADAIEGIPVPIYAPPPEGDANRDGEANREGEAPAEPNPKFNRQAVPPADHHPKSSFPYRLPTDRDLALSSRARWKAMPRELWYPFSFDELTPEIVAACADWGYPLDPDFVEYAKQHGSGWPRPQAEPKDDPMDADAPEPKPHVGRGSPDPAPASTEGLLSEPLALSPADPPIHFGRGSPDPAPASTEGLLSEPLALSPTDPPIPPVEDFSSPDNASLVHPAPADASAVETHNHAMACDNTTVHPSDPSPDHCKSAQPLLTGPGPLPVTEVQITPDHTGVLIDQTSFSTARTISHQGAQALSQGAQSLSSKE